MDGEPRLRFESADLYTFENFTYFASPNPCKMSSNVQEARDFLVANQVLLDEMINYDQKRNHVFEEITDADEKLLNEFYRLRTYILEKKMGLLGRGKS